MCLDWLTHCITCTDYFQTVLWNQQCFTEELPMYYSSYLWFSYEIWLLNWAGFRWWTLTMVWSKNCYHSSNSSWFRIYLAPFHCLPNSHWSATICTGLLYYYWFTMKLAVPCCLEKNTCIISYKNWPTQFLRLCVTQTRKYKLRLVNANLDKWDTVLAEKTEKV